MFLNGQFVVQIKFDMINVSKNQLKEISLIVWFSDLNEDILYYQTTSIDPPIGRIALKQLFKGSNKEYYKK